MTQLVLEVLEGKDAGLQLDLTDTVEAGRRPGLALTLDDTAAADQHARFTIDDDEAAVEDLGSDSGTYVNELQAIGRTPIRPGDRVRLGMTVVEVLTAQQATADRSRPKPPPVPELDAGVLEHVPEDELAPGYDTRPAPLRVDPTEAAFVVPETLPAARPQDRFGALGAWTDSRVEHQTQLAAFGLLAIAALAVALVLVR